MATGELVLLCKGCKKLETHPSHQKTGPTTGLLTHKDKCIPLQRLVHGDQATPTVASYFNSTSNKLSALVAKPSSQEVTDEILKFFVSGNISFNQASNPHFQQLVKWVGTASGELVSVSRKTIRALLTQEFDIAVADLRDVFETQADTGVSIALDIWTSRNGYSFMGTYL